MLHFRKDASVVYIIPTKQKVHTEGRILMQVFIFVIKNF